MHKSEIEIPKPCDEPWDAMSGCGVKRHCARCDQSVYDLSALSEAEARALLANPPAKLCVSYLLDEQGVIVLRRKPSKSLAIGLALSVAASAQSIVSQCVRVMYRTPSW